MLFVPKGLVINMLKEVDDVGPEVSDGREDWFDPSRRAALLSVLRHLDALGYHFVSPTPATHARVVKRPERQRARALRDVLGWSLPFDGAILEPEWLALLHGAGMLRRRADGRWAATLRVSRVAGRLYLHSAYPTNARDSVFLGPDSHRFARWIVEHLDPGAMRVLDYGAGAGVGGISAVSALGHAKLTLADINPKALFLAGINAEHAGITHDTVRAEEPKGVGGAFDLIVTHPPFMIDRAGRSYRDGGDLDGARLSLDWVMQGIEMLAPGGRLILHSGVSIVDGRDVLRTALQAEMPATGYAMEYVELDPDIFSEDLD